MARTSSLPSLALLAALSGCAQPANQSPLVGPPRALDPASTDGDKYRVLLENDQVRVLRYHDEPGARTHLHHHPSFVMIALAPFRRRLTFPDGTRREREFSAGEVAWMPAQSHVGENIGSTPTEVLLIEVMPPRE